MENTVEYLEEKAIFHGSAVPLMGTRLDIITVGPDKHTAEDIWKHICSKGAELDRMLSKTDAEGEVGRFNSGKMLSHTPISLELCEVLHSAIGYRTSTLGLYDISLGKKDLVDFWEEHSTLSLYGATLDFGGFRKGWLLEFCKSELVSAGVKDAFVDFGNSAILCLGRHPFGESWSVQIANPFTRTAITELPVCNAAVSISANGPGFSGRIIHPKSGEAYEGRRLVAVTSPSPLDAKVLSTALMIAKPDECEILQSRFPDAVFHRYEL